MTTRKKRSPGRIIAAAVSTLVVLGGLGVAAGTGVAHAAGCTVSGDTDNSSNSCGPYTDANIYGSTQGIGDTNVLNDVWAPPSGFTNANCAAGAATPCQTMSATDAEHWTSTANLPNSGGSVESYPDTQQVYTQNSTATQPEGFPDPLTGPFVGLYSTFSDTVPGGSGNSYDVGYDIWGGSSSAANDNWADEIMIWTNEDNRDGCGGATPALTGIQFGGTNGVPVQSWNLYNYGSERIWCNPSTNETSGNIDVYDMLKYLESPNYTGAGSLPADFGLNAIEYGVEWCYTGGAFSSISLAGFSLLQGTESGGGPVAPVDTTNAATGVTQTGATLNGSVNPEGAATTYHFEYGTSTAYGTSVPVPSGSAGSGSTAVSESAALTGLTAGTTYDYRIDATNSAGTTDGSNQTFTTASAPPPPMAPVVASAAGTGVTSSGATLNGSVNPEGEATTYQFDYGTTTGYGASVPAPAGSAGSGTSAVNESSALTGLTPSTTYHYRIEATDATGTSLGADEQFTTPAAGGGGSGTVTVGSSSSGHVTNSGTLTWTQPVGTAVDRAMTTEVSVGISNDAGCSIAMTDNGVAMTPEGMVHSNNQHAGYVEAFGITNPASGSDAMKAVVTGCSGGTPLELSGGATSYGGVSPAAPFGAPVFADGSGASTALTVSGAANDVVFGAVANGSAITSVKSPGTSRFLVNVNDSSAAGNSAGGTWTGSGSVATGWNVSSDWWGEVGLLVQHD